MILGSLCQEAKCSQKLLKNAQFIKSIAHALSHSSTEIISKAVLLAECLLLSASSHKVPVLELLSIPLFAVLKANKLQQNIIFPAMSALSMLVKKTSIQNEPEAWLEMAESQLLIDKAEVFLNSSFTQMQSYLSVLHMVISSSRAVATEAYSRISSEPACPLKRLLLSTLSVGSICFKPRRECINSHCNLDGDWEAGLKACQCAVLIWKNGACKSSKMSPSWQELLCYRAMVWLTNGLELFNQKSHSVDLNKDSLTLACLKELLLEVGQPARETAVSIHLEALLLKVPNSNQTCDDNFMANLMEILLILEHDLKKTESNLTAEAVSPMLVKNIRRGNHPSILKLACCLTRAVYSHNPEDILTFVCCGVPQKMLKLLCALPSDKACLEAEFKKMQVWLDELLDCLAHMCLISQPLKKAFSQKTILQKMRQLVLLPSTAEGCCYHLPEHSVSKIVKGAVRCLRNAAYLASAETSRAIATSFFLDEILGLGNVESEEGIELKEEAFHLLRNLLQISTVDDVFGIKAEPNTTAERRDETALLKVVNSIFEVVEANNASDHLLAQALHILSNLAGTSDVQRKAVCRITSLQRVLQAASSTNSEVQIAVVWCLGSYFSSVDQRDFRDGENNMASSCKRLEFEAETSQKIHTEPGDVSIKFPSFLQTIKALSQDSKEIVRNEAMYMLQNVFAPVSEIKHKSGEDENCDKC